MIALSHLKKKIDYNKTSQDSRVIKRKKEEILGGIVEKLVFGT